MLDIKITGTTEETQRLQKTYLDLIERDNGLYTYKILKDNKTDLAKQVYAASPNLETHIVELLIDKNENILMANEKPELEANKTDRFKTFKDITIVALSSEWKLKEGLLKATKAFETISKYEMKNQKPAFDFTPSEIKESVADILSKKKKIYSTRFIVKTIVEYSRLFNKDTMKDWEHYLTVGNLADLGGFQESRVNIKKQDLINLFDSQDDPQTFIIPLLLFEGVRLNRGQDIDEIRGLTKSAVGNNSIFIPATTDEVDSEGFRYSIDRQIEVGEEVAKRVKMASNQTGVYRKQRFTQIFLPLLKTKYVLRPVEMKNNVDTDTLSYVGVGGRLKKCKEAAELIYDSVDEFTSKYIINCGKAYYISLYMKQGDGEKEAIIKTLKRFGEWNSKEDEAVDERHKLECRHKSNVTRITRLKKTYHYYL